MIRKLFDKYGCDKGRKHGYDVYYQKLFDSYDKNINILEIGVFRGDSTLATHEYLEDATIYGVDIFERVDIKAVRSRFNSDRVHLEKCDSMSISSIKSVMKKWNDVKFDIIIDDAAHYPEANRKTLLNFMPYLNEGGTYVIEDVWPLSKMTLKELEHKWIQKYPERYNQLQQNMFENNIEEVKKKYNVKLYEHDYRKKSREPDSYLLEFKMT